MLIDHLTEINENGLWIEPISRIEFKPKEGDHFYGISRLEFEISKNTIKRKIKQFYSNVVGSNYAEEYPIIVSAEYRQYKASVIIQFDEKGDDKIHQYFKRELKNRIYFEDDVLLHSFLD